MHHYQDTDINYYCHGTFRSNISVALLDSSGLDFYHFRYCWSFRGAIGCCGSSLEIHCPAHLFCDKSWLHVQPPAALCSVCRYRYVQLCLCWSFTVYQYIWMGDCGVVHGLVAGNKQRSSEPKSIQSLALVLSLPANRNSLLLYFCESSQKTFNGLGHLRTAFSIHFNLHDSIRGVPVAGTLLQSQFDRIVNVKNGSVPCLDLLHWSTRKFNTLYQNQRYQSSEN